MIRVISLSKSFGSRRVLDELSCDFATAKVTALVGRNGSGKSTLLNCISCRIRPDKGRIELFDKEVAFEAPWRRARRGVISTFQEPRSTRELRLTDVLTLADVYKGHSRADEAFEQTFALLDHSVIEAPLAAMSYGQRKIANLAIAVAMQPRFILLDEPMAGLAPPIAQSVGLVMRKLAESGVTVVVIEHDFDFVSRHCDTALLLDGGRIALEGTPAGIFSHQRLLQAFQ